MQTDSKMSNRTPVVKINGNYFLFALKLCWYGKLYAGMQMDAKCKRGTRYKYICCTLRIMFIVCFRHIQYQYHFSSSETYTTLVWYLPIVRVRIWKQITKIHRVKTVNDKLEDTIMVMLLAWRRNAYANK